MSTPDDFILERFDVFDSHYYSVAQIQYQDVLYTPMLVHGGEFVATDQLLRISLSASGTSGTVNINNNQFTGIITAFSWTPQPYRGVFIYSLFWFYAIIHETEFLLYQCNFGKI